jgi:hypothetical protein
MAIAKARSSSPVRGYYVTTINTGRIVQLSGFGFGVPRLGGLIYAQVDGLTGGGSATTRFAAQAPHDKERFAAEEKERVKQHEEWKKGVKETAKKATETAKKEAEMTKEVDDTHKPPVAPGSTAEVVKDPVTKTTHVVVPEGVNAEVLNHPTKVVENKPEQAPPAPKK